MEPEAQTPARAAARGERDGVLLLSDQPAGRWAHGSESATERALRAARDRSDMSDELARLGRGWPQEADTARERGHIVRALALTGEHRVLEVGAGCGAVTRSLAERCGLVDALELNPERARIAALRLADRPNARVLAGDVSDLPPEPAYDVIVVIGVLEYIGGHTGVQERIAWLQALRACLRPGGHLVCAIENRFGVGYLAGGPEDHSGRLFHGIEDHPIEHAARTFARPELERLFRAADLRPTTLGVFPDYRFPRLVFSERLLDGPARSLAWEVPPFPTPPHPSYPHARVLDERRVWRGLVENGMGLEFANSHLVIAGREAEQTLWPDAQLAAFYSRGRRSGLATETRVCERDGETTLTRQRIRAHETTPEPLVQTFGTAPYVVGDALLSVLADASDAEQDQWLRRLRTYVEQHAVAPDGTTRFDLWPGNIVVAGEELQEVDTELTHRAMTPGEVLERALLLTALELPTRTVPGRLSVSTGRQLLDQLADRCGLERFDVDAAIRREAELRAVVFADDPGTEAYETHKRQAVEAMNAELDLPFEQGSIYGEARDAGPAMSWRVRHVQGERDAALAELARVREQLEGAQLALRAVETSRSWRLTAPLRDGLQRLRSIR